jgi:hypothetical protein
MEGLIAGKRCVSKLNYVVLYAFVSIYQFSDGTLPRGTRWAHLMRWKERMFFFEKKNQKTFASLGAFWG